MAKEKMITLTSERAQEARQVGQRQPRVIRIIPTARYSRRRYYLDGWLPVPSALRHLNGRSIRSVVLALGVAVAIVAWALWRLFFGAGR